MSDKKADCPSCGNTSVPVIIHEPTNEGVKVEMEQCKECKYNPRIEDMNLFIKKITNFIHAKH